MEPTKHYTLQPTLNDVQRIQLRAFVTVTLQDEELLGQSLPPALDRRVTIYVDGQAWLLRRADYWQWSVPYLMVGPYNYYEFPQADRLNVLLTLSQLCEPSEELTRACAGAITRQLLGQFNELKAQALVEAAGEISGIAFHEDQRMASCVNGEWMSASGEPVDVSESGWTVCATAVSESAATPEMTTETELREPVAIEPPATPEPPASPTEFAVGQQVRWTPSEYEARSFRVGEGVIEAPYTSLDNAWTLRMDAGYNPTTIIAYERDLTILSPSTDLEPF